MRGLNQNGTRTDVIEAAVQMAGDDQLSRAETLLLLTAFTAVLTSAMALFAL